MPAAVRRNRFPGPAYRFGATVEGVLGLKVDKHVIITSYINILTTQKGSIPYDPNIGSVVPELLFEPNDEITKGLIRFFTFKDLTDQEPRALVRAVFTEQPDDDSVVVTVAFSIVGDSSAAVHGVSLPLSRQFFRSNLRRTA